jgi:uncharacterized protein (DUF983 family)
MDRPSPFRAGVTFRCPVCGKGKLFAGFLKIRPVCAACGATLGETDSGDAPMVFAILILGFAIVGAALFVEVKYTPPYWFHAVLWIPALIIGAALLLPLLKSVFYALNYHHQPGEDVTRQPRP